MSAVNRDIAVLAVETSLHSQSRGPQTEKHVMLVDTSQMEVQLS
jgi:hypothetical protein